jgi:hypothetical protein
MPSTPGRACTATCAKKPVFNLKFCFCRFQFPETARCALAAKNAFDARPTQIALLIF